MQCFVPAGMSGGMGGGSMGGGGGGGNFGNQNFTQDTVVSPKYLFLNSRLLLLRPFPYLGSAHRVFNLHVLPSCASSILLLIAPPQFRSSYLLVSTHFHVVITTSSSVFLSTWPNHLSLASLICLPHLRLPLFLLS